MLGRPRQPLRLTSLNNGDRTVLISDYWTRKSSMDDQKYDIVLNKELMPLLYLYIFVFSGAMRINTHTSSANPERGFTADPSVSPPRGLNTKSEYEQWSC